MKNRKTEFEEWPTQLPVVLEDNIHSKERRERRNASPRRDKWSALRGRKDDRRLFEPKRTFIVWGKYRPKGSERSEMIG